MNSVPETEFILSPGGAGAFFMRDRNLKYLVLNVA